jgi:hypothetical protein
MNSHPIHPVIITGLLFALINAPGIPASAHERYDDSLTQIIRSSRAMRLPCEPLENKIREGRAKNRSAVEIYRAVKTRQKFLLQIRDNQQGNFTGGYTRQLFDLERSNPPSVYIVEHRVPQPSQLHTPLPALDKTASIEEVPKHANASFEKKVTDPPTTGPGNAPVRKADRQITTMDKKAEKTMKKAATRAEQRMKAVEKQMQKRTMKRQAGGK